MVLRGASYVYVITEKWEVLHGAEQCVLSKSLVKGLQNVQYNRKSYETYIIEIALNVSE